MGPSYGSSMFASPRISAPRVTNQLTFFSSQSQPPPSSGQPNNPPPPSTVNTTSSESPPAHSSTAASSEQIKPVEPIRSESRPKPSKRVSSSNSTKADSTDWIASSLTRRFGLGAGLAWVGFLAVGVVSEQIKNRLEVSQQEADIREVKQEKVVQLPNGIKYSDMRVGGGATPRQGDLVVIGLKGTVVETEQVFVDTFDKNDRKPLVLVMGSRPYTRGMCEGVEYVLQSMKAGGKRRATIPPNLGFKEEGADFGAAGQVPPNATLEYVVEVERVSIAPA